MAYIHFRIVNDGYNSKFECTLDGGLTIFFKTGEHVRIDAGMHLLTFDGGTTEWYIQETLAENDCLTVDMMIGYDEYGEKIVVGCPEYKIISLDQSTVEYVEETIKEFEDERAAKSKKIKRKILKYFSIFLFIAGVIASLANGTPLFMMIYGSMGLIGFIIYFVSGKKTK